MPYGVRKRGKCWQVYNRATGRVYSRCSTRAKATRQKRLLESKK